MLPNAFSKSIKLAYRGAFHSLLCYRICLRVKNVVRARAFRAACSCLIYSSSASARLVWIILMKTLLVMGSRVTPIQLWKSPKSPFLGNLTIESGLPHFRNRFSAFPISIWICTSKGVVLFLQPWAFLLSLLLLHMPFGSSSLWRQLSPIPCGTWIYADIQVLCCRWNLS